MVAKTVLVVVSLFLLGGCASTSSIAARYEPTPTPVLVGYWFANNANQAQYLKINTDGTGAICWESMSEYRSAPIVISNQKMVANMESEWSLTDTGFQNCKFGFCADFKRIAENRIAPECKSYF